MIEIRTARDDDDAALARVDADTWTADVSPAPAPPPGSRFFGDRTRPEDVLVAVSGGEVVGYVKLHQPIPLPSHEHVLELNGLAVAAAAQGGGAGRRLVEAAVEEARRRRARKLSLRVLGPNVRARRLYETCGFVVEGVLKSEFRLGGAYVDDVLMARYLA